MLHILLLILKIIGITIAALVGLLFLLVLIVLFVPIRYRAEGRKDETIVAKGSVSWILGILFLRFLYLDEKFCVTVRIFGFPIYDNQKPKKIKKPKKVKPENENVDSEELKDSEPAKEDVFCNEEKTVVPQETDERSDVLPPDIQTEEETKKSEFKEEETLNRLEKIVERIKTIARKVKEFFRKIIAFFRNLLAKKRLLSDFLHNETNQAGIKHCWSKLWEFLKYIAPQKVKGHIRFGTGDPCITGQLLGTAYLFYGLYGDNLSIEPDFDDKLLEAEVKLKGRIRIIRLLIIAIQLKRDENFNRLIKNAKRLKEEM